MLTLGSIEFIFSLKHYGTAVLDLVRPFSLAFSRYGIDIDLS